MQDQAMTPTTFGIAIGPNGDLVMADANASGGSGAVIVVDPQTQLGSLLDFTLYSRRFPQSLTCKIKQ